MKNRNKNRKGFSLAELLVVIAILSILSVSAVVGIQRTQVNLMNDKMLNDLLAITNALEQYREDHDAYPIPVLEGNKNILCFDSEMAYSHDCEKATFVQAQVDNMLLTKRYLQEVPTDPRTGSRYSYGVTINGRYFQIAGNYQVKDGNFRARMVGNIGAYPYLNSVIRSFNGPEFVVDKEGFLPYSPDHMGISGTIRYIEGTVTVDGDIAEEGDKVEAGQLIVTDVGSTAVVYFSDGSIVHIDPDSELKVLPTSTVEQNDEDGIATKIKLKLFNGKIWNKVVRLSQESEFNVETTSAIAGVRGTEFGIDAETNEVVVLSGKVATRQMTHEEQQQAENEALEYDSSEQFFDENQVVEGDGQSYMKFEIPGANGNASSGTPITSPEEYIEDYYSQTVGVSSVDIPYISDVQSFGGGKHKLHITFNGFEASDAMEIDGFEVFTKSQTRGVREIKEGALEEPFNIVEGSDFHYEDSLKVFIFELYDVEEGIVVRAFHGDGDDRTYSSISWPVINFVNNDSGIVAFDNSGVYQEFKAVTEIQTPAKSFDFESAQDFYKKDDPIRLMLEGISADTLLVSFNGSPGSTASSYLSSDSNGHYFTPTDSGKYELTSPDSSLGTVEITACGYVGADGGADYGNECWVVGGTGVNCTDTCLAIETSCIADDPATDSIYEGNWNVDADICSGFGKPLSADEMDKAYAPYLTTAECKPRKLTGYTGAPNQNCNESFFIASRICKCE